MEKKKPKKNSKLEDSIKKKIKFELRDVLTAIKKKKQEPLVKKVKETKVIEEKKVKESKQDKILYEQSLSQKVDYDALFSYLGNRTYDAEYKIEASETVKIESEVMSYKRVDEIMIKKIFDDMVGGVKEYLDSDEEARYDLWRKLNPAMWRFKFDTNNKFGYKMIVE